MRVLYLSQYFPPEVGATQTRALEMARNLVRLGHQVTILAEIPNHPTGIIPPQYRHKLYERADLDGIDVIRVWVKTSKKKTGYTRMALYLTYMISSVLASTLVARRKYDVVYATSPPLFVGCAGLILSRLRGAPFVFEVRDLWPAVAVSLGELRNPGLIRLAEALERLLYRKASAIVAVTRGFCRHIEERGIQRAKLTWIPNGTMPELFDPARGEDGLRERLGLTGKFIVTFAGLHGLAQGLPTVLDAAESLLDDTQVQFLFIGEGPVKGQLLDMKEARGLRNVMFLPGVPTEEVVPYLIASDVLLVPLKADHVFETFIPSKLFDFMSCAKPIILSVPGEAQEILEDADAGVFVPPGDWRQLRDAVLALYRDRRELERYGRRAREYVIQRYTRRTQAEQLARLLESLLE